MKVLFKYPLDQFVYVNGPTLESLNLETSFQESEYLVTVHLEGDKPLEIEEHQGIKYYRRCTSLSFEMKCQTTEPSKIEEFKSLVKDETKRSDFVNILASVINRVLLGLRNYGTVPHIQEVHPNVHEAKTYLFHWEVIFSENDKNYQSVLPKPSIADIFNIQIQKLGKKSLKLESSLWPYIEEAIQDKLEPPPEQEFFTNTIEFLQIGNLRMALLESTICLEIVLTQYLQAFLSIRKNIPSKQIKKFLKPEIGLTARLAGLLNLTLDTDDLKNIDIEKLLEVVEWRNDIVHRTGHLPPHLKEEDLREGISRIFKLALLLAERGKQIQDEPKLQEIAKKISDANKVPIPNIWFRGQHYALVEIQFLFSEIPERVVLEKVSQDLSEELKKIDQRFVPERHLFIRFLQFPKKPVARWYKGKLEIAEEKKENEKV
jgi:hypothetical protein